VTSIDDRGYVRTTWFGDAEKEHGYFHLDALISGPAEPQCVERHDRGDGIHFEASANPQSSTRPIFSGGAAADPSRVLWGWSWDYSPSCSATWWRSSITASTALSFTPPNGKEGRVRGVLHFQEHGGRPDLPHHRAKISHQRPQLPHPSQPVEPLHPLLGQMIANSESMY
jgi:hypothetical protein